jgi:tripartite-type tricarboxylate transporter receptor subunit TctC
LATGGQTREDLLPDVPTAAEAGYPNLQALQWIGLLTTGGTPLPIVERLNAEVQRVLKIQNFQARLEEQGMTSAGGPPSEFRSLIRAEIAQWTEVVRKAKVEVK